jgi:hypothetical protein
VQRGRGEPDDPGEQVREQPLGVPQEGAFALNPTKLLEEGKRDDLRVGEPLYGLVAMGVGIEQRVSIVYEAEEGDDRLFRSLEASGMVLVGHPELRTALFLSQPTTQQTSRGARGLPPSPACTQTYREWRELDASIGVALMRAGEVAKAERDEQEREGDDAR